MLSNEQVGNTWTCMSVLWKIHKSNWINTDNENQIEWTETLTQNLL